MRSLFLLLFTTSLAFGQDSTIAYKHRYALKFDIGALIDPDRTVQVGLEFPISRRTSWQTTLGYGWNGLMSGELRDFDDAKILRMRNEVRFYTGRYRTNRYRGIAFRTVPPLGNYWALELLTKQINYRDEREINYSYGTGFIKQTNYTARQRYVMGLHVKAGRQFALPRADKSPDRLLIDIFAGAGIRYINVVGRDVPTRNEDVRMGMYDRFELGAVGIIPSLTLGVKVGFAL